MECGCDREREMVGVPADSIAVTTSGRGDGRRLVRRERTEGAMADQIYADVDPHRELFERAEEFVRAALVAKEGTEQHYLYEQARQLQEEILDTPALSIVGALMKLRLGLEEPQNADWVGRCTRAALRDLERLVGSSS